MRDPALDPAWIRAGWKVQLAASDFRSAIGQRLDRASTDSSIVLSLSLSLSLSFSLAKVRGN